MLKIYDDTHPILRKVASEVPLPLSKEDSDLLFAMAKHLIESKDPDLAKKYNLRPGVGLAAPQVGVSKRLIVLHYPNDDDTTTLYMLANPKIISQSVREAYLEDGEGCLSVPEDHAGLVFRPNRIKVKAFDLHTNKDIVIRAEGYDAIVLQHEIDHLNGVLYYDHINPLQALARKEKAVKV